MRPVDPPPGPGAGAASVQALVLGEAGRGAAVEWVAEEVPVALAVNGISHAVMLATPLDLEDFALGFLLSEGLIDTPADLLDVEVLEEAAGMTLDLRVTQRCLHRFKEARRSLAGRTGCGICGTESLQHAVRPVARPVAAVQVAASAIARAMRELGPQQRLQQATGATHAAAWCGLDGAVRTVREDVGRHNALDKLVGAMAAAHADPAQGFIAVTSRASYEMVHKTATAGVGLLAAISAPTRLAVATAEAAGLALVGFARGDHAVVYTHADRVLQAPFAD